MPYQVGHLPPALPTSAGGFLAKRKTKAQPNLIDLVEEIHLELVDDKELGEKYRRLLYAVHRSQTVQGSVAADHFNAADMIQRRADKKGRTIVAEANWVTIGRALNWVLHRFQSSRTERLKLVNGHAAPEGHAGRDIDAVVRNLDPDAWTAGE